MSATGVVVTGVVVTEFLATSTAGETHRDPHRRLQLRSHRATTPLDRQRFAGSLEFTAPASGTRAQEAQDSTSHDVPGTGLLTFEQACTQVLAVLQEQMPLGLWAITRRDGDHQVFLATHHQSGDGGSDDGRDSGSDGGEDGGDDDGDGVYGLATGAVVDWQGSMCQAMVAGGPRATHDAAGVPEYAAAAPLRAWPVRTYLAAPIPTPQGTLFGTLCGYGAETGEAEQVQELAPVVQLLADLLGQVLLSEQLRAEAQEREAHLYRMATRDHLTGLANRAVLHDRLTHALDLHRTSGRALSVLLIDVDDFKAVNDTHGHSAGDALLALLAVTWGPQVRAGNTLARIGGDEFALLIETGLSVEEVLQAVHQGLAHPITVPGTQMVVTTSVGVAYLQAGDPSPTAADLLCRADAALYATKAAGKAGVTVFAG